MTNTGPKTFLSYMMFDKNFVSIFTTAGFVYVYLSNENETPVEVYYDEFTVDLKKSPVINSTDLYPYGAPALLYQRENSFKQDRLLNGMEWQDELGYNTFDLGQRDIDPYVPVFPTQDRFSEKYHWMSPYQYAAGNPINVIDVNGDSIWIADGKLHITGAVYDATGDYNSSNLAADLTSGLAEKLQAAFAEAGIELGLDIQIRGVESLDDGQVVIIYGP